MMQVSPVLSGLMGVCVGDALGVPVEFTSRSDRLKNNERSRVFSSSKKRRSTKNYSGDCTDRFRQLG